MRRWRKLSRGLPSTPEGWPALGLCVGLGLLAFLSGPRATAQAHPLAERVRDADDYYLGRYSPENMIKGLQLLRAEVAEDPKDYEAWWRLSKFICYQTRHTSGSARTKLLEDGIDAGKKAITLAPNRVEGHYWLGSNYDQMSDARGYLRGLLWVDEIRKEMELVVRLDPEYEEAGGQRTLARLDYRAPFFLGGDKRRSMQLLKDCLTRYPENSTAMLYLSDSYLSLGLRDDAHKELQAVLNLCPDSENAPELAENQGEAQARIVKYFHSTP